MDPIDHHRNRMHHHHHMAEHFRHLRVTSHGNPRVHHMYAEREHYHRGRAHHHRMMMESFRHHH